MASDWYSIYNFTADTVPITFPIPWTVGSHYSFFWICYITVLVLGVLTNGGTFLLLTYNKNVQKLISVPLVKYLVIEDFLFSIVCLIQCCLNLGHNTLFGDKTGCIIEAWQVCFFVTVTGYSLCLIAYATRVRVTAKSIVKTNPPILKIHIGFWIFGALFATGATVWPGSSRMPLSGTYCIPAYERVYPAFFFFGMAIFPTIAFLATQYIWIFIYVSRNRLENSNVQQNHFQKQLKLARQLGSLVVIYFIFYTPFLSSAIYEWSTHSFAVVMFDFGSGVFTHAASVANPMMYLWTTNQAKRELKRVFFILSNTVSDAMRITSTPVTMEVEEEVGV